MARCINCGKELPPHATICPACGESVHICIGSTASPVETELFEARLRSTGLPYLKQPHRGGGLLRSLSNFSAPGADFFVPAAKQAETLRALGMDTDDITARSAQPESEAPKHGNWKTRILGLLIVAVLLTLYFGLDALLSLIRHLFGAP
ncbi:zinc ribbon domain-containing protein [Ethanoligenens sp.]|uniref:zinc ribbon domain-containing protein n=1 Tax=Ethanoligenens sp. TaxID=2099655 RepID=UPI0039EC7972